MKVSLADVSRKFVSADIFCCANIYSEKMECKNIHFINKFIDKDVDIFAAGEE